MKTFPLVACLILASAVIALAGYGSELASFSFGTSDIVRDNFRDRVYCSVPSQNSVVVIDSESLAVLATIFTGSSPAGMGISPDGSRLYVANSGETQNGITVLDLSNLTIARYISTTGNPTDVAVGAGVVYCLEGGDSIRAYNTDTGAPLSGKLSTYSGGVSVYSGLLEISPDRKTLYYFQNGSSPSTWYQIDVSSWPGTCKKSGNPGGNGSDMAISADGNFVCFAWGSPYSISKWKADDPSVSLGTMATGAYPRAVDFSVDGNSIFTVHTSNHIEVWDANTFVKTNDITTVGDVRDLECDRKGKVLFAGTNTSLKAYYVSSAPPAQSVQAEINNAVEIRWDSNPGTLYQVQWTMQLTGTTTWFALGGPIVGTGLKLSVYSTLRDATSKFYRVQVVTP